MNPLNVARLVLYKHRTPPSLEISQCKECCFVSKNSIYLMLGKTGNCKDIFNEAREIHFGETASDSWLYCLSFCGHFELLSSDLHDWIIRRHMLDVHGCFGVLNPTKRLLIPE